MKHLLVYSAKAIVSSIAILGLIMMFITACGSLHPIVTSSATPTDMPTQPICKVVSHCLPQTNPECVIGNIIPPPDVQHLLNQDQPEIIGFDTQINEIENAGGTSNYILKTSIPAGLLPNQTITEVDITSTTDISAVKEAVLSPDQNVIMAVVWNQTQKRFTGIKILRFCQNSEEGLAWRSLIRYAKNNDHLMRRHS